MIASGATSKAAWPFIECMEEAGSDPTHAAWCLNDTRKINASAVLDCYENEYDAVLTAAGAVTGELCNSPSGCLEV